MIDARKIIRLRAEDFAPDGDAWGYIIQAADLPYETTVIEIEPASVTAWLELDRETCCPSCGDIITDKNRISGKTICKLCEREM